MSEVKVRPGDNITLYCDCKPSTGVFILWFRNCSHENQPTLVLDTRFYNLGKPYFPNQHVPDMLTNHVKNKLPRLELVKNFSSDSYDLLIRNISGSDEGFYYCGTAETKVEENKYIESKTIYKYSHITTRVKLGEYLRLNYLRVAAFVFLANII